MIYRAEPKTLLIFNADIGITAALSGKELSFLKDYLINEEYSDFISRLYNLKLLPDDLNKYKNIILDKINETEEIESPKNSFTAPESIHIDITTACPLNCRQCYKHNSNYIMPTTTFFEIIEQAKNIGVFQIAIGGGEPLLVKDLEKYVKYVRQKELACTITTSGYGLTEKLLNQLEQVGINHIQVSLNGSTREIHNMSRDGFLDVMNALKLLSRNKVPFGINWVARMDNVYDFKNVLSLAKQLGAKNLNILRYKPSNMEDYYKITLSKEAYKYLKDIIKEEKKLNIKVDSAFSSLLCDIHDDKINPLFSGCGAGRRFMIVDSYGRFKPCSHMKSVYNGEDIKSYWYNSSDLIILRNGELNIKEQCNSCKYLNSCRGCRAICESLCDDINAGEQNCYSYKKRS